MATTSPAFRFSRNVFAVLSPAPTAVPTFAPTTAPTFAPTATPTAAPTAAPINWPLCGADCDCYSPRLSSSGTCCAAKAGCDCPSSLAWQVGISMCKVSHLLSGLPAVCQLPASSRLAVSLQLYTWCLPAVCQLSASCVLAGCTSFALTLPQGRKPG